MEHRIEDRDLRQKDERLTSAVEACDETVEMAKLMVRTGIAFR